MKRVLFDVEADGLLPTLSKVHCICTIDVDTLEERDFGPGQLQEAIEYLKAADIAIAHFGLGYDFPAIYKILGLKVPDEKQLDTVVIARVKRPNIKELDSKWNKTRLAKREPTMGDQFGKHTIEAWGIRLGLAKLHTDIEDWSQWTPQIQERCHGDVQTNLKLWQYLNPDKMSQAAIELEHRVQRLTNRITEAGWPFDEKAAGTLHADLVDERHKVEQKLVAQFGGWYAPKSGNRVKGDPTTRGQFIPKRTDTKKGYVAGQLCTKIEWITFNPGSRPHIERSLRKLGWVPTEFTEKGNAKLDEEQLDSIALEFAEADGLTRYLMLDKRLGQLAEGKQAWLSHVVNGKVHCQYNPMGTVTSRASHFNFNIGQVPSIAREYGERCRALFVVPPGWSMLGADMDGLEGRCQAHYMAKHDGGAFGRELLSGDPHWKNALALGLAEGERDKHSQYHTIVREKGSKTWYYAWIYGSGKEKSGRIILDCLREVLKQDPAKGAELITKIFGSMKAPGPRLLKRVGSDLQETFLNNIPALGEVIRSVKLLAGKHGKLPGLDGRILPIRSDHSAFNALLQSAGAILCKRWICDAYDDLIAAGFKWGWDGDFVFLGWIHDEIQVAVRNGLEDKVGDIIVKAAQKSGEPYGFRIKLDSSYKIGPNWATTH